MLQAPRVFLRAALLLAFVASNVATASAADQRPRLRATRIARPPVVDGIVGPDEWQGVPVTDAFTQKFPGEGRPPTEKTFLRVGYDEQAIYVAIECEQRLAPVEARLTRRDRQIEADWVAVIFDSRRDGRSAFVFNVNAAGVLTDLLRYGDTEISADWDDNWEALTASTPTGWSAEMRIPLRILRFESLPVQSWGFQARRYVSQRQETDEWAFIPRNRAGEVSQYGKLDGLEGLHPGGGIELEPFVWGRVRRRDVRDGQLASGTDLGAAAGLDLKWHPSQAFTLNAAFLPDFAQVEADQVILNLSNVEPTFPEKRRFFLDGSDTFATSEVQYLYSRRIGRVSPAPALRQGEALVDVPTPATILGAIKATGTAGAWQMGLLSAATGRNTVDVQLPDGTREQRVADPLSSFNVLRVKRALGDSGYLGVMATSVLRADGGGPMLRDPTAPRVLCADGREVAAGQRCSNDAHAAGLDWHWRSGSGDYASVFEAGASLLGRGPPRALPDGTIIRPGDVGTAVRAAFAKEGGDHWLWGFWGARDSRDFDVNDAGYLDRANQVGFGGQLTFRTLAPFAHTLETSTKLEPIALDNHDRLPTQRTLLLEAHARLDSYWTIVAGTKGVLAHFDDREVGDGAALERAGGFDYGLELQSDPRARLSGHVSLAHERLSNGARAYQGELGLLLRVLAPLDLELIPQVLVARGEPRFAATAPNGDYLFGALDARSAGTTLRATWTFTPRLTLQTYAQLFLASRHYGELSSFSPALAGPRPAIHLADLVPGAAAPPQNPDTQEVALNANVVLRWEWRPGCLLYLVYTRSQSPALTLAPGEVAHLDLRAVRRAPAADVALVKVAYWWGN
jgi:hypothetical protein